jgi:uncharacterized paraquat-inducible protein A
MEKKGKKVVKKSYKKLPKEQKFLCIKCDYLWNVPEQELTKNIVRATCPHCSQSMLEVKE